MATLTWKSDLADDLLANKQAYLRMAKELPTEEQETVELLFLKLEGEMKSWEREQKLAFNAKVVNIVSAAPQHAAYKKHKINPYIAGGADDGIFGPVAGVIAATDNMVRNDQIDTARAEADRNVIESGIKAQMAARVADAARKYCNRAGQTPAFAAFRHQESPKSPR